MFEFSLRTSPQLVRQIASIERCAGRWERIAESEAVASPQLMERSIARGSIAAFALDQSTPPTLAAALSSPELPLHEPVIANYIAAHTWNVRVTLEALEQLFLQITTGESTVSVEAPQTKSLLRSQPVQFMAPEEIGFPERVAFPTLQPFLVKQRTEELTSWINLELERGTFHPLIIIGTFHLLFLQIHPFAAANHRLSLLLTWHLLQQQGFEFVQYNHFAPYCAEKRRDYFSALRQAEKTARGNWSTLTIWLEFFSGALQQAAERLLAFGDRRISTERLTSVQKRILEVIKSHGPVSRERIVSHTGLNLSTIKYNLGVLSERGHLRRHGGGRTTSYRLL